MILHPRAVITRCQLKKNFAPMVLLGVVFLIIVVSSVVIDVGGPSSLFLRPLISTITFASSIVPTPKYRNVGVFNAKTYFSLDSPSDAETILPPTLKPKSNVNNDAVQLMKPRSEATTSNILLVASYISSITLASTLSTDRFSSTTFKSLSTTTPIPSTSSSLSIVHPTKTPEVAPGLNTISPSTHPGTTVALGIGIPALAISIAVFVGWWVLHASPPDSERLASWDSVIGGLEAGGAVEGNMRRDEEGAGRCGGASNEREVGSGTRNVASGRSPKTRNKLNGMDILFEEVEIEEAEILVPRVEKKGATTVLGVAATTKGDASRVSSASRSNVVAPLPIAPFTLSATSSSLERVSEELIDGDGAGDVRVRELLVEKSDGEGKNIEGSATGSSTQHVDIPPSVLGAEDTANIVADKESDGENRSAGWSEKF